jgi:hypothetical protein
MGPLFADRDRLAVFVLGVIAALSIVGLLVVTFYGPEAVDYPGAQDPLAGVQPTPS